MVDIVIDTNTSTAQTIATGDDIVVLEGVSLYSTSSNAITATGTASNIVIFGSVISTAFTGVRLDIASGDNSVYVGSTGSIFAESTAIFASAFAGDVVNHGVVHGDGSAIKSIGAGIFNITNTGVLSAGDIGSFGSVAVVQSNIADLFLNNSGTIDGGLGGVSAGGALDLFNSGFIGGGTNDLAIEATGVADITNTGILAGDVNLGSGNDTYDGRGGELYGRVRFGEGADVGIGGDGDDILIGQNGTDNLRGGDGNDILRGGNNGDTLRGDDGDDLIDGDGGVDLIFGGSGDDELFGGFNADTIHGGRDNDMINGEGGNDILNGNGGDDIIFGEAGNDIMNGGGGDDIMYGGGGIDKLDGGYGTDTAVLAGNFADYTFELESDGELKIVDTGMNGMGTDRIINIEFIQFDDGVVSVEGLG